MADALIPQQQSPVVTTASPTANMGAASPGGLITVQNMLIQNRRLLLFVASSLMLVGFVGLMIWSADPPYRALYSGMNEKDSASIVELLQKEHIPYKLEGSGTVLVPKDQIYSVRLKLAGQDMMPGNGTGFEIFDKNNEFGISDFAQKIKLQRALQGELSRTIEVLPQVTSARVHLVMPKESAFAERDRKATASVMLQLIGSQHLPKQTILAIQSLVSAAIPDLERGLVTVVDSSGNLLSGTDEKEPSSEGQTMQAYQTSLEHGLEGRLTGMLEQVVGSGQAVVRVTADINREHVEQNSQRYNPDEQVIRSQKTITESRMATDSMPMGVPGVASNTPGANPTVLSDGSVASASAASPGEQANRSENTKNYEISLTSERKVIPYGTINKMSVAVIVGGTFTKDGTGNEIFVPRDKAELKNLRRLVERAVGYDEDRGDSVEMQSMPLLDISSPTDSEALDAAENKAFYIEIARYGVAGFALLLMAWFLLKPLSQHLSAGASEESQGSRGGLPSLSDEAYARLEQMERTRSAVITNPERANKVVSQWMGS
ncbi:MAG: flagellar basal-body MS-ring/collar protein FliF [Mariprofundaceae bacterium]